MSLVILSFYTKICLNKIKKKKKKKKKKPSLHFGDSFTLKVLYVDF